MEAKFCPKCGTELVWRSTGERARPTCPACGHVVYFNPVVGAGALIETDGRVVLIRRGVEPKLGYWSLPSGYVEADELAEAAAVREAEEETGLQIELDDMLGVYSFGREPQTGVLILYSAYPVGGELKAGDDAQEVRTFAPAEVPPDEQIAFRTHLQALRDWRRARAVIYRQATPDDSPAVLSLAQQYSDVDEGSHNYPAEAERGLLLALDREELVGIASVSERPWSHAANIDQVFVRPDYRRWGIATQLVNHAVTYAREQGLRTVLAEAPVTNPILLVYLKAGFRVSGFIDTYYPPGREGPVTALFLAHDLDRSPGADEPRC
jgi:ADP-ribose pyrophosphatase YjhB (NUDIX family)/predicted GNAT family acetyltransferase